MNTTTSLGLEIPPLQEGDRLTADEFHRRYEAMPELKNANLIDGVVHMSSPLSFQHHGRPDAHIQGWLYNFHRYLPGVLLAPNSTWRIDEDNEPQPDQMLFFDAEHSGSAWLDDRGYVRGVPELVVEVAASSARLDAGEKRELYQAIGVREYILWRTLEGRIDWWNLVVGTYQSLPTDEDGVIKSEIFPGLWLHAAAMIRGDIRRLTDVLEAGMATPEHKVFAERLRNMTPGGNP